jgi:hypothetical protein
MRRQSLAQLKLSYYPKGGPAGSGDFDGDTGSWSVALDCRTKGTIIDHIESLLGDLYTYNPITLVDL